MSRLVGGADPWDEDDRSDPRALVADVPRGHSYHGTTDSTHDHSVDGNDPFVHDYDPRELAARVPRGRVQSPEDLPPRSR